MDAQLTGQLLQAVAAVLAPVLVQAYRERRQRSASTVRRGVLKRTDRPTRRDPQSVRGELPKAA